MRLTDTPDARRGLSAAQAAARLARDGPNALPEARRRTLLHIAWEAAREPMFALLLAGGLLYLLLGELREGILMFSLVVAALGITLYQEGKTEHALAALRELSSPRATVLRDGVATTIDSRAVVCGDLCIVREGDRVPADGTLVAGADVLADESLLTGESEPVRKLPAAPAPGGPGASAAHLAPDRSTAQAPRHTPGQAPGHAAVDAPGQAPGHAAGDAPGQASGQAAQHAPDRAPGGHDRPFLYSGTLLVQGHGLLCVTATGAASRIGQIGAALHALVPERSPLQRQVRRLVTLFATGAVGLSLFLTAWYVAAGGGWLEALLAGIALAIALLPQEFAVVLAVFPALGAWRLARAHVLTRRLAAIETLGTTSVLCVDKTGTLTENRMSVAELHAGGLSSTVSEAAVELPEPFHALVEFAVLASGADSHDPMDKALHRLGQRVLAGTGHLHPAWTLAREYGLSPGLRAMSHAWLVDDGGDAAIAAKGAPEAIVDLCHLEPERARALLAQADAMAANGLRVLGVARAVFDGPPWPQIAHDFDFVPLGLIGFADPLRAGVAAATRECHRAGIRVIMITGDYPATARHIARQAGIEDGVPVTGDELAALTPVELDRRLRASAICARVAPEQKLLIVQALKAGGAIVTMTGDGVNDAPALRAAHVGVAMGQRGTDVAREAASLVLLDDAFDSIVRAVRLGRHIFNNMQKAMIYILAVHVPTAGMALLPVLLGWPIMLSPVHIVFLELLIDPTCALAFENEAPEPDLMRRGPRDPRAPLLGWRTLARGLLQGAVALGAVMLAYGWALQAFPLAQARGFAFSALVLADVALIFANRSQSRTIVGALAAPNRIVWVVAAAACAALALVLYVPGLAQMFFVAALTPVQLTLAAGLGLGSVLLFDALKLVRLPRRRA